METFVVRVFVPAGDEELELTGVVEHSRSGRSERFRGTAGLVDVVLHQLELGCDRSDLSSGDRKEEQ